MNKIFLVVLLFSCCVYAAPITWIAQSPNNNMDDSAHWNPSTVPGSGDSAIFNSSLAGVSTNPTESSAPFSVTAFNFPNLAAPFLFTFNNQRLAFSGVGITGAQKNPTLSFINTNNTAFLGDMISFASLGTMGSARITGSNNASLAGAQTGQTIGVIGSHLHAAGAFTIESGGTITATNSGLASTTALGGNSVAIGAASQVSFDDTVTSGDTVTIEIENSGTFNGSNSANPDSVGIIQGYQCVAADAFVAGDNFNCIVENNGNNSNAGIGNSKIGVINAAQMALQTTGVVGDDASITITNTGINSAATTVASDQAAYLNDNQFFMGESLLAGDKLTLTVSNAGNDNSTGIGQHQIALINSNSGTSGDQVLLLQGGTLGNNATISVTNSGTYTGTNTGGGCQVGGMNLGQYAVGDSTSVGSYSFRAGDGFNLTVTNSGIDSAAGTGGDAVGAVSTTQVSFFTPCSLGDGAQINISNEGTYTGSNSATYVNVGSAGGSQLIAVSTFEAGDDCSLSITNAGNNESSGNGNSFIGDIITGQQAHFDEGLILGDRASVTITNTGSNSASTVNSNQVGSMMGYGKQLMITEGFIAGNDLQLTITNSGFDNSTVSSGNFVGFINNNTLDSSASQVHLANGGSVGNNASISIANVGTFAGDNAGSNAIAVLAGAQMASLTAFEAGDQLSLGVSMTGTNNGSGQNNNNIAVLGGSGSSQVQFGSDCTVGNDASFVITNKGVNNDASGTNNFIGYITSAQMSVAGDFTAGTNLIVDISNSAINAGDTTNFVGYVTGSQLSFAQVCRFDDGATITVANSGTVGESQILFGQGFDVLSGKATIHVTNTGTVTNHGIEIQGSNAGGNAEIILGNTSLYVAASSPTFTIAGLEGDETSIAQSQPMLIINRDTSRQTAFTGVLQDFSNVVPTVLTKTGAGTQILSGANTYTGLTTVQNGILVLNGTLGGDICIDPAGTLKGSLTTTGTLTNTGTIAPGQSIGTLTVGNYVNNGGDYEVEVNGAGQSDLIHATGSATINGGSVLVSSVDGTFKFKSPYTIVTADTSLTGTFTNATASGFITPILTYDANNVFLTLNSAFSAAAKTCNQTGVATILDTLVNISDAQALLLSKIATSSLADAQRALESLSGFQYTNEVGTTEIANSRFLRRLYDPLRYQVTACDKIECFDWTSWLETGPDFARARGANAYTTKVFSYQVTGGIQKDMGGDFSLGVAASYEYDHEKFINACAHRNALYLGLYGLYRPSWCYLLFDIAYGYKASDLTRTIKVGDLSYTTCGKPNVNTFALYAEYGIDMDMKWFMLQPFAGLQVEKNWRAKVAETNTSGWGLVIDAQDWAVVNSRLGIHLTSCNLCPDISLSCDLAWDQRLTSNKNFTHARFQVFGDCYCICGNKFDDTSVDYALTLTKSCGEALQLYVEFEGQWWNHANTNGVLTGLKYSW